MNYYQYARCTPTLDRVSLSISSCPVTYYVDQAGLEFTEIPLPLLGLKICSPGLI